MRQSIVVLLLIASPAFAYKPGPPERHDVFSRHKAFVLDVNPATKVHTVYDVRDRTKPLWSFSEFVWRAPCLLSDDGQVVATVEWKYVQEEDIADTAAVTFWNKDGEFRSYPLSDICPDPPRTTDAGGGPVGDFWRTWYNQVQDHGDSFTLRTTCGIEYRFRYADGALVSRQRFALRPWGIKSKVAAGVLILGCAAVALWYRRRRLATQAADRQRLVSKAATPLPAPESREGILASKPVGRGDIRPHEPSLPRLEPGRPDRLAVRLRVLEADRGAIAGVLLGVPSGAFFGALLGMVVGNSWDMLELGIWGGWIGGFACALSFAILARDGARYSAEAAALTEKGGITCRPWGPRP